MSLAAGPDSAAEVFQVWRNDPTRDAQMLNPTYKEIGIGCTGSTTAAYDWYWVATFGSGSA